MHGTLAEMTGNDWNVLHVPRPCFIAPKFSGVEEVSEAKECKRMFLKIILNLTYAFCTFVHLRIIHSMLSPN